MRDGYCTERARMKGMLMENVCAAGLWLLLRAT